MATVEELGQALLRADQAGDTDAAQALANAIRQMGGTAPPPQKSTIMGEVARGAKQFLSSGRTGLESIVNPEAAAVAGVERGKKIGEEAGEGASFEAVKNAYNKDGVLAAAGEVASQIPRAVAGQIPQMGAMLTTGRIGAGLGSLVGGPAGAVVGGIAGAGLGLLPNFMGSNVEDQARKQQEENQPIDINRTKAYSAAAAQAALEGAGTVFTLGKRTVKGILGIAEDAALNSPKVKEELAKIAARSVATAGAVGAKHGLAEVPVELGQQILERAQSGRDLTSPDAMKDYGETIYQTLLVGPTIGGVAGISERNSAKNQLTQKDQATSLAAQMQAEKQRRADALKGTQEQLPGMPAVEGTIPAEKEIPEPTLTKRQEKKALKKAGMPTKQAGFDFEAAQQEEPAAPPAFEEKQPALPPVEETTTPAPVEQPASASTSVEQTTAPTPADNPSLPAAVTTPTSKSRGFFESRKNALLAQPQTPDIVETIKAYDAILAKIPADQTTPATESTNGKVSPPANSEANVGTVEPSVPVSDGRPEVPTEQPQSLKTRALERANTAVGPTPTGTGPESTTLTQETAAPVEAAKPTGTTLKRSVLKIPKKAATEEVTTPISKQETGDLVKTLQTEKDPKRYYDALHTVVTRSKNNDIAAWNAVEAAPLTATETQEVNKRTTMVQRARDQVHSMLEKAVNQLPPDQVRTAVDELAQRYGTTGTDKLGLLLADLHDAPRYRLADKQLPVGTKYITKPQTEAVIKQLTSTWTNMPETEVVENTGGLPADLRTALDQSKDPVAAHKGAKAVYYKGKVWVVSDNHASTGDVITSILHEVAGHHGLQGILGDEFDATMKAIYDTNADVRAEADAMMKKEKDLTTALATEEVLADRAETGRVSASILTRIANAIRRAIRTLSGGKYAVAISNNEVQELIADARKFVKTGEKTEVAPSTTPKARSTLEESAEEFGDQDKRRVEQSTISRMFKSAIEGTKDVGLYQYFRTQLVDSASTIEEKMSRIFTEGTKDFFGNYNPLMLLRQSRDINKLLKPFYERGDLKQMEDGTFQAVKSANDSSVRAVVDHIKAIAEAEGITFNQARSRLNPMLEANRLWHLREANNKEGAEFVLHKIDPSSTKSINEQIDAGKVLFDKSPEAQKYLQLMDDVRFTLIDRMVDTGRLSFEEGQLWKDASGYIAFDRLAAPSMRKALRSGKGIGRLTKLPEFKGSNKFAVGDLFENMLNTYGWMIGEIVNNQARTKTLDTMDLAGFAKRRGDWNNVQNRETAVRAFENGKEVWYELKDKIDMLAFDEGTTGAAMTMTTRVLAGVSNVMRTTVTATPMFTLKQVIDDSTRIMFYPGLKRPIAAAVSMLWHFPRFAAVAIFPKNSPMRNLLEAMGAGTALDETQRRKEELESKAITGEYDFNSASPAASYLKDLGIEKRGIGKKFLHTMEEIARASDIAARSIVYEESKKEGASESQASTRARELINFRRQGASKTMQFFTTTVPFFNASIQGTDLLLRAITGTGMGPSAGNNAAGRKQFLSRAMTMAGMSLLYTMMMSDDDEYRNASQALKDKNILLPGGFKISLPSELSTIFKAIPERAYLHLREEANKQGKSDIDEIMGALKDVLFALTPGLPVPVLLRPVAEAFMNYSFLTGRELEGTYQQNLPSALRYTATTSELAKAIGVYADVSPIKVDNFLTSWFGMTGSLVSMVADGMMNPNSAERPIHKLPFANLVTYDNTAQAQIADAFYDTAGKARNARNGLKLLEQEHPEKAQAFYDKNAKLIALAPDVEHVLQQLEKLRQSEKYIRSSDMTPADKAKALEQIKLDKNGAMADAKAMQYFATH